MGSRLEKNSESVRKQIEGHSFENEEGDEYEASKFGGFADYFRRKKIKLQNLDAEIRSSSSKPKIFKGIVCHVNGYTQPSLNDLHHLIVSHGGGFMQYLDGKTTVTHIIASNLTLKKAVEFRRYRIVKPAWVVDSMKAGKLLPWDSYRLLDEGVGQKLLAFDEGKVISQAAPQPQGYRDHMSTNRYTSQVKNIADNVDDGEGTLLPSTQANILNGTGVYTYSSIVESRKADGIVPSNKQSSSTAKKISGVTPNPSGNYEISSLLEDALKDAIVEPGSSRQTKFISLHEDYDGSKSRNMVSCKPTVSDPSTAQIRSENTTRKRPYETEPLSPSKKGKTMTAEEHNAILLADPHIRKSSTANPDFIKQYYSESRLHHLSAWKADLKSRFQQMAAEKSASQNKAVERKPGSRRYIMHVDFDCFFCAVSLMKAPEYVDKPAVVAHGSGAGSEIASCNYPARAFGVKNGMWMKNALKLCPGIKVLPYDFPAYEDVSKWFYEAILDVGGIVQSVSIDEALVDISTLCLSAGGADGFGVSEGSIWREQEKADSIALALRDKINDKTGCAVSVGIGGNILLAKVALRKAKPAGQHQIKPEDVLDFIGELTVQDLPGVAHSIGGKLEEIGVRFVKDVRQLTKQRLITALGPKTGEKIWDYSRGIDRTEVGEQVVRKSVSAEVNWGIRFISQPEAEEFVQSLCVELQHRLLNERVKGRQLTMKIMRKSADAPLDPPKHLGHGKCDIYSKSIALGVATNKAETTGREAISILRSYGFSPGELRGLGIQMTKLEPIKATGDALPDGSQRRINFGVSAPKPAKQTTEDPIDDPITPKKSKETRPRSDGNSFNTPIYSVDGSPTPHRSKSIAAKASYRDDPIDDSPQKARATFVHPAAAIARANAADNSAKKFLNLTGTQFIMPTQVDPETLAELPQDIRAKLVAQGRKRPTSRFQSPAIISKSQSPIGEVLNPPLPSQLDLDVFESLPEDLKTEILASYFGNVPPPIPHAQNLPPQSPPKFRTMNMITKTTPTKKRGRGRPPRVKHLNSTYKQTSFVPLEQEILGTTDETTNETADDATDDAAEESDGNTSDNLDLEFLSALPEEVRREIIDEHRQNRLAQIGGFMTSTAAMNGNLLDIALLGEEKLLLPPRSQRPTFTTQELSTLPELREALSEWYNEFVEDGPHLEDVAALVRYLKRVVLEERDMLKVVGVTKWIQWLIDETNKDMNGKQVWGQALAGIKEQVQAAVGERGLGRLEL